MKNSKFEVVSGRMDRFEVRQWANPNAGGFETGRVGGPPNVLYGPVPRYTRVHARIDLLGDCKATRTQFLPAAAPRAAKQTAVARGLWPSYSFDHAAGTRYAGSLASAPTPATSRGKEGRTTGGRRLAPQFQFHTNIVTSQSSAQLQLLHQLIPHEPQSSIYTHNISARRAR
jgi:hypothetical protein